jgi:hypothetical protein
MKHTYSFRVVNAVVNPIFVGCKAITAYPHLRSIIISALESIQVHLSSSGEIVQKKPFATLLRADRVFSIDQATKGVDYSYSSLRPCRAAVRCISLFV